MDAAMKLSSRFAVNTFIEILDPFGKGNAKLKLTGDDVLTDS